MIKKLLAPWLTGILLVSCQMGNAPKSTDTEPNGAKALGSVSGAWQLFYFADENLDSLLQFTDVPVLSFKEKDSSITGTTGCNRLMSSVIEIDTTKIIFAPIATTKMYCTQWPEAHFLDYLTKTDQYALRADTLILMAEKRILLKYKRVPNV